MHDFHETAWVPGRTATQDHLSNESSSSRPVSGQPRPSHNDPATPPPRTRQNPVSTDTWVRGDSSLLTFPLTSCTTSIVVHLLESPAWWSPTCDMEEPKRYDGTCRTANLRPRPPVVHDFTLSMSYRQDPFRLPRPWYEGCRVN